MYNNIFSGPGAPCSVYITLRCRFRSRSRSQFNVYMPLEQLLLAPICQPIGEQKTKVYKQKRLGERGLRGAGLRINYGEPELGYKQRCRTLVLFYGEKS